MPLHVRSIAVTIAVICFFVLSFICWMIGAAIAYVAGAFAVKAINAILINAMITNQMKQQEETENAGND
jgi:inner membrane protein involved in colicin E2 resistance